MINFLLGWLLKPRYMVTALDRIMFVVELVVVFILIIKWNNRHL